MKQLDSLLGLVDPKVVGPVSIRALDAVQAFSAKNQACALALAFVLLCNKHRCHPGNVLNVAENILRSDQTFYPEVRALRDYINYEV